MVNPLALHVCVSGVCRRLISFLPKVDFGPKGEKTSAFSKRPKLAGCLEYRFFFSAINSLSIPAVLSFLLLWSFPLCVESCQTDKGKRNRTLARLPPVADCRVWGPAVAAYQPEKIVGLGSCQPLDLSFSVSCALGRKKQSDE